MTNEAVLRTRFSDPINMACTELAMEKGTILKLSGARGVGASAADGDVFGGFLAREKISGDGRTQVAAFFDGIFDCQFDTAVTQGAQVTISGANILKVFTAGDSEDGTVVGRVLETVAAAGGYHQVLVGRGA